MDEQNNGPHPHYESPFDFRDEFARVAVRKKRARRLMTISSLIITTFFIISYLGYTIGRLLSNTTSVTLTHNAAEIRFSEVGFRVGKIIPYSDQVKFNLRPDTTGASADGGGYVYWSDITISPQTMRYVVEHDGYSASNRVQPITSKAFKKGDSITLYERPSVINIVPHVPQNEESPKDDYVAFTILFRLASEGGPIGQEVGLHDYGIFFSKDTQFRGNDKITKSLRLGFESKDTSDIISPGYKEPGITYVGGRLDLDGDGFYDTTYSETKFDFDQPEGYIYEIAYGEFTEELVDADWDAVTDEEIIYGTSTDSVLLPKTKVGVRPLIHYTPAKAEYSIFKNYTLINEEGEPIAYTNNKGIAELNIKIWLEGWDVGANDSLLQHSFGAQLKFSAAKLEV